MAFSSLLKSTETGQTRFPLPRSRIYSKNYENWNLAIILHHGSKKSGFVEIEGHLQNFHSKGQNSIATIPNFQLGITFYSRYEISIFRIRSKDIHK